MPKYAFMSMDVESYFDTLCLKNKKIDRDPKYNCAEEILTYANFLTKHHIKGTFFVTADFIPEAKKYLLEVVKQGHEIALHCFHHQSYKRFSKEEFRTQIKEAKKLIEDNLGVEPVGFRFPKCEYSKQLFEVLKEEGFIYDSSVIRPNKSYKRITDYVSYKNGLVEFSPNIYKFPFKTVVLSGGGFYRFLKGKAMTKELKKHIAKHDTFMVYFHPFEIHKGYLPVPKNIMYVQKKYLTANRDVYLDSLDKLVIYLKENRYEFSSMKEFATKYQKEQ